MQQKQKSIIFLFVFFSIFIQSFQYHQFPWYNNQLGLILAILNSVFLFAYLIYIGKMNIYIIVIAMITILLLLIPFI